jgi:hypothetical protein
MDKLKYFIAGAIVLALAAFAVLFLFMFFTSSRTYEYNGKKYKVGQAFPSDDGCNSCSFDKEGRMICTLMACNDSTPPIDDQKVDIQFEYKDNAYTYTGTVEKPTPCDKVMTDTLIKESYPEQVDLRITITSSDQICAQVISKEDIQGEIKVSSEAVIDVYLNGELIKADAAK